MFISRYVNPDLTKKHCMETIVEDLAVVTIEISSPEMIVQTRDTGLSFADKLGVVGNAKNLPSS